MQTPVNLLPKALVPESRTDLQEGVKAVAWVWNGGRNSVRGVDHCQELQAILEHAVHHTMPHLAISVTDNRLFFLCSARHSQQTS